MDLARVDEGSGPSVVLVHGTPSSSFEFRHVIEALSVDHRCLAVDHLGFGQSPKPPEGDYSLRAHQRRFEAFLEEEWEAALGRDAYQALRSALAQLQGRSG